MSRIVSGIIAVILLALYVYAIWIVIHPSCPSCPHDVPDQVMTVLELVGGLVSALVIAVLAITPPNSNPAQAIMPPDTLGPASQKVVTYVIGAYLLVWLLCGVALLFCWMHVADPVPALSSAAKSWLGLAVAAAYSYLGLHPPSDRTS